MQWRELYIITNCILWLLKLFIFQSNQSTCNLGNVANLTSRSQHAYRAIIVCLLNILQTRPKPTAFRSTFCALVFLSPFLKGSFGEWAKPQDVKEKESGNGGRGHNTPKRSENALRSPKLSFYHLNTRLHLFSFLAKINFDGPFNLWGFLNALADHFRFLERQDSAATKLCVVRKRRFPDSEFLELWNVWSGRFIFRPSWHLRGL